MNIGAVRAHNEKLGCCSRLAETKQENNSNEALYLTFCCAKQRKQVIILKLAHVNSASWRGWAVFEPCCY